MTNEPEEQPEKRMVYRRFYLDGIHPLLQLFFLAWLTLICMVGFMVLGMYLVRPLFGVTTIDLVSQTAMSNPDAVSANRNEVNALKLVQFMSSIGAFVIPALVFARFKFPGGDYLRLRTHLNFLLPVLALLLMAFSAPIISLTYEWNRQMQFPEALSSLEKLIRGYEDASENMSKVFAAMPAQSDLWINLIMLSVIPAIGEELLFRGCIQQVMKEWVKNAHVAIWITAFLFSFIHLQFYGFLPRLFLGALLGYFFFWSGSLWVPIIAHAFFNGLQIVLMYLHEHHIISFDVNSDDPIPVSLVLVATALFAGAMFLFRRVSEQRTFIY